MTSYRDPLPDDLRERAGIASVNGHRKPSSPSPSLYMGSGRRDAGPELVKLAEVKPPGPRRYLLRDLVLAAYVTLLYGDGGVAKSLLALALAVAVASDAEQWLGRRVEGGTVLVVDFELDAEEQARRLRHVCRGAGLEGPPQGVLYLAAVGYKARDVFRAAHKACKEHDVALVILDSYGVALAGDAEAAKDVIAFNNEMLGPFRALGVAVLVIDHQSKLQLGQSYQQKGAFGSVYKSILARSTIQAEATERGEGTLTVRLRQKKHSFGPLADPFGVKLRFCEEAVTLEATELGAAEKAEEATLNAVDRVKHALESGPAYPWEIAETTTLAVKTVKNALSELRKQGVVEPTGEKEGRGEQVRLIVPASLPYKGDGDASFEDLRDQFEEDE
jgi:RecA-family ATPase